MNFCFMNSAALLQNETFHAAMELPWKATFIELLRPVVRDELIGSSGYGFSHRFPGFLQKCWPQVGEYTVVDPFRLGWLLDFLHSASSVDGDVVECGSFKGGSGILMALALKQLGLSKRVHLFDSFEGLPEPDSHRDKGYRKGQFKSNFDLLLARIQELELTDIIQVHRGWFRDTVTSFLEQKSLRIALLHVDCDLYSSTRDCFPALYPFVSPGGAVVLDDFNDGGRGEKRAILELMEGHREVFQVGPASACYFKKGQAAEQNGVVITDAGFDYSFSRLFADGDYMSWLNGLLNDDYKARITSFRIGETPAYRTVR
jgi:O-methyltransferase